MNTMKHDADHIFKSVAFKYRNTKALFEQIDEHGKAVIATNKAQGGLKSTLNVLPYLCLGDDKAGKDSWSFNLIVLLNIETIDSDKMPVETDNIMHVIKYDVFEDKGFKAYVEKTLQEAYDIKPEELNYINPRNPHFILKHVRVWPKSDVVDKDGKAVGFQLEFMDEPETDLRLVRRQYGDEVFAIEIEV